MTQYINKSAIVADVKEAYCSYEVSKLLKEKGFDWECTSHFDEEGKVFPNAPINFNVTKYWISRPTSQMAMKWLREKHNLFFGIGFGNDCNGKFLYMVDIFDLTNDAVNGRYKPIVEADDYLTDNPKTYEEAVEAALEYSLKNLL